MSQIIEDHKLPELGLIIDLLRLYGDALFESCPTSEELVLFGENQIVSGEVRLRIQRHLIICMDCKEKVDWVSGLPKDKSVYDPC